MRAIPYKTRSERRLEQLEALQRPLTKGESAELRRCLHAIYCRNWRLEQSIRGKLVDDMVAQTAARLETGAIADRMEAATDDGWPESPSDRWMNHARDASAALGHAIRHAGLRP